MKSIGFGRNSGFVKTAELGDIGKYNAGKGLTLNDASMQVQLSTNNFFGFDNTNQLTLTANVLKNTGVAVGNYYTRGHIVAGWGGGSIAMTINDGKGNSNLTFNHVAGRPDQDGNAFRIETNTDSKSNAKMIFELRENCTKGTLTNLYQILKLRRNGGINTIEALGSLSVPSIQSGISSPKIKFKNITGTYSTTANTVKNFAHGIPAGKDFDVKAVVRMNGYNIYANYSKDNNKHFEVYTTDTNIVVVGISDSLLLNKPIKFLITYEV